METMKKAPGVRTGGHGNNPIVRRITHESGHRNNDRPFPLAGRVWTCATKSLYGIFSTRTSSCALQDPWDEGGAGCIGTPMGLRPARSFGGFCPKERAATVPDLQSCPAAATGHSAGISDVSPEDRAVERVLIAQLSGLVVGDDRQRNSSLACDILLLFAVDLFAGNAHKERPGGDTT